MTQTAYEQHLQKFRYPLDCGYLTSAEHRIVKAYMQGASQADLARSIGRSKKTIQEQLRRARTRTGARTIHQLIAMVARADALRERGRSSNEANPAVGGWGSRAAPSRVL